LDWQEKKKLDERLQLRMKQMGVLVGAVADLKKGLAYDSEVQHEANRLGPSAPMDVDEATGAGDEDNDD
jgi:hypothetical protein